MSQKSNLGNYIMRHVVTEIHDVVTMNGTTIRLATVLTSASE